MKCPNGNEGKQISPVLTNLQLLFIVYAGYSSSAAVCLSKSEYSPGLGEPGQSFCYQQDGAGQGLEVERGEREQQVLYISIVLFNPHNNRIFMSVYSGGTEAR